MNKIPYFVNVYYNRDGKKVYSSMYKTLDEAEKYKCIDGYRFVETITVFRFLDR